MVVFSRAFFGKNWPQYELDGLVERAMQGRDIVLLPVWHSVTHDDVMHYSPSLAGLKAVLTDKGIKPVADAILDVVHPQGSPLIVARDMLIEWNLTPPVITDKYWLEIVQASNRVPGYGMSVPVDSAWNRWSFPLPGRGNSAEEWGEKLAWTAMQMNWINAAESIPISPLSHPEKVLDFIYSHPGLYETCETFPDFTAEYAPQLTIPGMGGELESVFEELYHESLDKHSEMQRTNSKSGSGLTTNGSCPLCDEKWVLRHPTFGNYESLHVTYEYFNSDVFGPQVSPFHELDHLIWLLSSDSAWLPEKIRAYLLDGMQHGITWLWGVYSKGADKGGVWDTNGALSERIMDCIIQKKRFRWTKKVEDDALNRISEATNILGLTESP